MGRRLSGRQKAEKRRRLEIIAFNIALQISEKINLELLDKRVRKYVLSKDDPATIKRVGVRECRRLLKEPTISSQCADTIMRRSAEPRVNECADDEDRALVLY